MCYVIKLNRSALRTVQSAEQYGAHNHLINNVCDAAI
jgi:hypothetical protein